MQSHYVIVTRRIFSNKVTENRPHIIIKNKKEKTCILIVVLIPTDRNVTQKEAEKKLNSRGLCIEIQRKWNMKCMVIG